MPNNLMSVTHITLIPSHHLFRPEAWTLKVTLLLYSPW